MLALELAWLVGARGWTGVDAALRLAPGALMILALRLALTDAAWPWIALALAASFPAHLADLSRGHARAEGRQFADR